MKKGAFPIYVTGGPESGYHPGMTLREYYAGQALAGMLAGGANWHEEKATATIATKHADALIAELDGGK